MTRHARAKERVSYAVPLGVFSDVPAVRATIGYGNHGDGDHARPPATEHDSGLRSVPPETRQERAADRTEAEGFADTIEAAPAAEAAPPAQARYEERDLLGEGGMGEVVRVHDHAIGRDVALKRSHESAARAPGGFLREARIIGALEHPNIVPVHDVGVGADGRPYFVMKNVEGETLEAVIESLRRGDPEYVRRWTFEARIELFVGLLRALEYAHSMGVRHRDIKPANVMVGRYGEVVLMDWGIALRAGEEDPARGRLVGTPYYMSPEQARLEPVDDRSDLYSASVLFHELVLLEHYLEPLEDPREVLRAVSEHGWRWSMMDWFKVRPQPMPPMELYHFVHKGMQHARDERWASARAMIDELQRILEGRVRVQCHLTLTKRAARGAGRFVDRRPWLSFGILAATSIAALYGMISALAQLWG